MIKWEERYKTGDDRIDQQHKLLFEFFNDLEMVIEEGKAGSYMKKSFGFVEHYIQIHFGIEENCMNRYKCPFAEKNKMAHEQFKVAFEDFKNKVRASGYSIAVMKDMHQFLEGWITNHIIGIDTHLKDAIKNSQS